MWRRWLRWLAVASVLTSIGVHVYVALAPPFRKAPAPKLLVAETVPASDLTKLPHIHALPSPDGARILVRDDPFDDYAFGVGWREIEGVGVLDFDCLQGEASTPTTGVNCRALSIKPNCVLSSAVWSADRDAIVIACGNSWIAEISLTTYRVTARYMPVAIGVELLLQGPISGPFARYADQVRDKINMAQKAGSARDLVLTHVFVVDAARGDVAFSFRSRETTLATLYIPNIGFVDLHVVADTLRPALMTRLPDGNWLLQIAGHVYQIGADASLRRIPDLQAKQPCRLDVIRNRLPMASAGDSLSAVTCTDDGAVEQTVHVNGAERVLARGRWLSERVARVELQTLCPVAVCSETLRTAQAAMLRTKTPSEALVIYLSGGPFSNFLFEGFYQASVLAGHGYDVFTPETMAATWEIDRLLAYRRDARDVMEQECVALVGKIEELRSQHRYKSVGVVAQSFGTMYGACLEAAGSVDWALYLNPWVLPRDPETRQFTSIFHNAAYERKSDKAFFGGAPTDPASHIHGLLAQARRSICLTGRCLVVVGADDTVVAPEDFQDTLAADRVMALPKVGHWASLGMPVVEERFLALQDAAWSGKGDQNTP